MSHIKGPLLLCILDGFGLREETEGNAIKQAYTPYIDGLFIEHPHAKLLTHGPHVGLPEGQMGNSEVGHMTIGSGRIILQNLERIRQKFQSKEAQQTPAWKKLTQAQKEVSATHIFGLISNGGVHSHTDHILTLCKELTAQGKPVYLHIITDGRDTAPFEAEQQIQPCLTLAKEIENLHIASISGRFYAMDRDNRWERVQKAYTVYTQKTNVETDVLSYIQQAKNSDVTDEFIEPVSLYENGHVKENDVLVFANFRADRMRQLVRTFIEPVDDLNTPQVFSKNVFCMTEYDATFNDRVHTIFPPEQPQNTIGEVIAKNNGKQLRIAESEKYAHVTFFLNGGREVPFEKEDRIVIPSPKVKTYDLAPLMSLPEVTDKLLHALNNENYELIVLNIANGDQVGHSGDLNACIKAVEGIDAALARIIPVIKAQKGEAIIIADHGNCEQLTDTQGGMHTAHTLNPVPLLYVGRKAKVETGGLADVSPTILSLMGYTIPEEMTGKALIHPEDTQEKDTLEKKAN